MVYERQYDNENMKCSTRVKKNMFSMSTAHRTRGNMPTFNCNGKLSVSRN